jgi:integrase
MSFSVVSGGIYRGSTGALYERPWIDGRRTWRKLSALTIRAAKLERAKKRSDQGLSTIGLAKNPYGPIADSTVAALLDFYVKKGCPRANHRARAGRQLDDDLFRVKMLQDFFGTRLATAVNLSDCERYHKWRRERLRSGTGDRTVDLELTTLSAAFRCAIRYQRETGIKTNPVRENRVIFTDLEKVRHARDVQPRDADELHRIARYFFDVRESEVLGWLMLFQAFTGRRINELVGLRADAKDEDQPGFWDATSLYFKRRISHKGTAGFIKIDDPLRSLMGAHRCWLRSRYPKVNWYFPGPDGLLHVDKCSLTRGLARATALLELPHRTSHGLRSYHVNVLRSDGIEDHEIALRIGQKSAGKMIVDVYGERRPDKIGFLPMKGPPAWEEFSGLSPENIVRTQFK